MIRNIIIIIQSLYWIQGITRADDVIQPNMIFAQMGQSATVTCEHTKGAAYTQMYWFRQVQGESMKLIAFTASYTKETEFGDGFDDKKFSTNKKVPESGSLTVTDLDSADSAVYYCSVKEHSVTASIHSCTKT
ncbi:hypothetical protein MHYP_G00133110 [Metynnis hypsauchen]